VFSALFEERPYRFTGTGDSRVGLVVGYLHFYPNDLQEACSLSLSTIQAIMENSIEAIKNPEQPQSNDLEGRVTKTGHVNRDIELKILQSVKEILNPPETWKIEQISQSSNTYI